MDGVGRRAGPAGESTGGGPTELDGPRRCYLAGRRLDTRQIDLLGPVVRGRVARRRGRSRARPPGDCRVSRGTAPSCASPSGRLAGRRRRWVDYDPTGGSSRLALPSLVDLDLTVEQVDGLVRLGMAVERRGLALRHHVLEEEEGAGRLLAQELPRVEPPTEERLLVTFAGGPDDRRWSVHVSSPSLVCETTVSSREDGIMMFDVLPVRARRPHRPEAPHPRPRSSPPPASSSPRAGRPTVEATAEAASVSRATAYRYFPTQRRAARRRAP